MLMERCLGQASLVTPSLLVVNPGQSDGSVHHCPQDDSEDDGHDLSIKKNVLKQQYIRFPLISFKKEEPECHSMAHFFSTLNMTKHLVCVNPLQGLKFAAPSLTGTKCNREGSEGLFTPVSPLAPPSCPPCLCSGGDHGRLAPSETSSNATTTQSLSPALSLSLLLLHLFKFQYHFEHCYLQKDWILRPM